MRKNGQTMVEYSVLTIIIVASLVVTGNYVKRSVQGRWKSAVDDLGDQYDPRTAAGYVKYETNGSSNSMVDILPAFGGYETQRIDSSDSREKTTANMTVNSYVNPSP